MKKYGKPGVLLAACWLASCQTTVTSMSESQLQAAANQGDREAQFRLATTLASQAKYREAMEWMQKASGPSGLFANTQTRSAAALQVGDWYQAGLGEPKNSPLARQWWTTSSELGNGEAGYRLGSDCQAQHQGKVVVECLSAFESAASKNYAPAQLIVAQWYASHAGGEREAARWLQKAADQGDRDAQYQLAQCYEQGKGVAARPERAEREYFRAATQGQPQAQLWIAQHQNDDNALKWYCKAALSGEAEAQLWLGKAYRDGKQVTADEKKAKDWLAQAAAGGSGEANYLLSQGGTDTETREHYLTLAAAAGYVHAQRELGDWMLQRNQLKKARDAYASAAAAGDTASRLAYGEMLRWGQGGKEDYSAALQQYRLAAQQGNRMAQYRMGCMRQDGLGASRNRIHAYAWYAMAATEGMNEAIQARNDLEAIMQPDEIKAGQRLAMHWSTGKSEQLPTKTAG